MTDNAISESILGSSNNISYDVEQVVIERYQAGAREQQPSLCCPTNYDGNYLEILPDENYCERLWLW